MPATIPHDQAIFESARRILDPAARAAFVREQCAGNPDAQRRILPLLAAYDDSASFLESPAVAPLLETENLGEAVPLSAQIGPYKLREVLGEGGMGIVYAAEQEHPVRRRVALKVIKPGMDTREVIARLEAERQALALMDHPNIAKLLDAGTTGGGDRNQELGIRGNQADSSLIPNSYLLAPDAARPYFVMELVRGLPITDYCDQAKLGLRERLKLFITVCQAVQHAHQKGIIHRDIKPSNVMITLHDGVPVPKVIDFGVAKALNQRLTEHTLYTRNAQLLGTPLYMSPEQAELSGLDVDTRSDVYSLGVLLYELLTGQTPFDKEMLQNAGFDELRRMIREVEPSRPSQRMSTLGQQHLSTVASRRGIDDRQLSRTLRGELDWIVMKALEKDRTRRYGSADALAADLQRFLDDEPVQACPPSLAYRLRKVARRKREVIGAFTLALVSTALAAAVVVIVRDQEGNEIARITSPTGSTVEVQTDGQAPVRPVTSTPATPDRERMIGLLPDPPEMPGIGRWQIITTRACGPGAKWAFDWSPDGQFIAFGSLTEVRVYAVPSLQLVRVFLGHTNTVTAVAWSPDGKWVASTGFDAIVRLWNYETGEPGASLVGHRDRVNAVAWHPDSRRLASGGGDHRAIIWTVDGTLERILPKHDGAISSIAWSPDGELLATDADKIRIWNRQGTGDQIGIIDSSSESIDWSPDGRRILASTQIWNLDGTEFVELNGHTATVRSADWSPDGKQIATASQDNSVRLWKADGSPGPVLGGSPGEKRYVKWSPDGQWLASGGEDSPVRLWRPDGSAGPALSAIRSIPDLAWHPDGEVFAAAGDRSLRLFRGDGTAAGVPEGYIAGVTRVDWSSTGEWIASGTGREFTLRRWNADSTAGPITERYTFNPGAFVFSPNRMQLASTFGDPQGRSIGILDLDGSGKVKPLGDVEGWCRVTWSPHGDRLLSFGAENQLRVWTLDGSNEAILTTDQYVLSADWKPDGTQIACGYSDGRIQLCRPDGKEGVLLDGHNDLVTEVRWSGDGKWLASGDNASMIRLWTGSGQPVAVFRGHAATIQELAWRPHSHQLLSGGRDGTIRLWDADTQCLKWVTVVLPDEQSLTLSPDGTIIDGDPAMVERELAYIFETPTGAIEVVEPVEFRRRMNHGPQ